MKKGIIIIVLITLSLILFKPPKINAATTTVPNWADGLPQLSQVRYLSCSSTTTNDSGVVLCNGSMTIDSNTIYTGSGTREFVTTNTNMTIGTNGYNITLANPIIAKTGYIYNISLYTCSNVSYHNANYDLFFGIGQEKNNRSTTISKNLININSQPGMESSITFNYCTRISTLVVPGADNFGWVNLRLTSDTNISGLYLSTISLEVRELGLYNGEIENIIQNSGFASAESVEQVQESVDRVEEAITGDYDYNDTPSEELEGKEEIDNLKNKEEELLGNLDFSGAKEIEITIEPESASFIWQIVDSLRSMSGKIMLLITSILGLGIIKMILNR